MDLANYQQKEQSIEYEVHQGEKDFHNCQISNTGNIPRWKYLLNNISNEMFEKIYLMSIAYSDTVFIQPKELWTYFKWISLEVQTQCRSVGSIEDHLWWKSTLPYQTKSVFSSQFLFRSIIFCRKKFSQGLSINIVLCILEMVFI